MVLERMTIREYDSYKVNLIRHLFGRHRHAESTSTALINWAGESGKQYQYEIYALDTSFQPLPGNFIYAKQDEDGRWTPIYIAQTREFNLEPRERMNPWASAHNTI
jgi:hypothetical protein